MRAHFLATVWVLIFTVGCGTKHIRSLTTAEAIFNRASEADTKERLVTASGLATSASAAADYRLAAKLLDDLIAKKSASLKTDHLYCTAVALQSLSRWRIGDHDAALQAASSASDCSTPEAAKIAPRDAALIRAVPGLIRIDQAEAFVGRGATGQETSIKRLITDAHRDLNAAAQLVSGDAPVREYLIIAHLAGVRVLEESTVTENLADPDLSEINKEVRRTGRCWLTQYASLPAADGTDYESRAKSWDRLLGSLGFISAGPDGKQEREQCRY